MTGERLVKLSEAEADRLTRLYMAAEAEILRDLDRAMGRGLQTDHLRWLLEQVQAITEDLVTGSRTWCEQAIPRIYLAGATAADAQVTDLGRRVSVGFGAVHQQAMVVLADATFQRLTETAGLIGRRVEDLYRRAALDATRQSIIGARTWQQVAKDYRDQLRAQGITTFQDAAKRNWNMTSYSEMVARTTTMEAHLEGTANRLLEHGYDLVRVSTHLGACEKCAGWQGRVLSLTGQTDGYPTMNQARTAGLYHPRCRHAYGLSLDLGTPGAADEGPGNPSALGQAIERTFKQVGSLDETAYDILAKSYGVNSPAVHLSRDTARHIDRNHPELSNDLPGLVGDILGHVSIIQRNARDDTVRIVASNEGLSRPISAYSPGKWVVLVLRLQPAHAVNFVKAIYPRDKLRKSDELWSTKGR
jgi:hypothetical protein